MSTLITATTNISTIDSVTLAALTPLELKSLTRTQLAALSSEQLSAFSATLVAMLPLKYISAGALVGISTAAISGLDLKSLSVTQIAALSVTQIAALTDKQMSALQPAQFNTLSTIGSLSSTQLNTIKATSFKGLTTDAAIPNLPTDTLAALTSVQLSKLTTVNGGQLESFTPAQVAHFSSDALTWLHSQNFSTISGTSTTGSGIETSKIITISVPLTSITGGNGADSITGSAGDDFITGGLEADSITGGLGADTITGSGGSNIYSYNAGDSTLTAIDTLNGIFNGYNADLVRLNGIVGTLAVLPAQSISTLGEADLNALLNSTNGTGTHFKGGSNTSIAQLTYNSGKYWAIDLNGDGTFTASADLLINVTNSALTNVTIETFGVRLPTLSIISTASSATEDTEKMISFANLVGFANEADARDIYGQSGINAFVVESVNSNGTLKIGSDFWATGTNDVIDSAHAAYWTPAANANGTLNAFSVVAKDSKGYESLTSIPVTINMTAVIDSSINAGITPIEGFTTGTFTVTLDTAVPVGGLMVNYNLTGSAMLTSDYTVSGSSFTIAAGSTTGTLNVNAILDSSTDLDETVTLNLVTGSGYQLLTNGTTAATLTITNNDAPALTIFASTVASGVEDTAISVTFANLQTQGDDSAGGDDDLAKGDSVTAFVVKAVSSGTLMINGAAWNITTNNTIDSIKAASWTPATNANGTIEAFTVVAQDSRNAVSAAAIPVQIAVTAVNDAPIATNLNAAETYTEDTPLNFTDVVISDVDSPTVTATLTLSNSAAGSLNVGTSNGVTPTFSSGIWSVTGIMADVNILLAGLIFTPTANFNSNFTISTSVSDGQATALTGNKPFTGTAVNDAPTATNATQTLNEDTTKTFAVADFGYADVENGAMASLKIVTLPTAALGAFKLNGVTVTANQVIPMASIPTLTYTPATNANGTNYSNFTFTVNDGLLDSAVANAMTLNVTAVNDIPTLTAISAFTGTEDTERAITFADLQTAGNEADVDGSVTSFVVKTVSTGTLGIGTTSIAATAFNALTNATIDATHLAYWTPAANANGVLTAFSVVAKDDSNAESTTAIPVQVVVSQNYNGHTYLLSTLTTWSGAEAQAIAKGGHLVTVNNAAENAWLTSTFSGSFWLGFNDAASEGNFVWANGEPTTYTNWAFLEPNNFFNEDYVGMYDNGFWNDFPDSSTLQGIIEIAPPTQYASSVIGFSSQYSPGGWAATQALGAPNTFGYGDISTAWTTSSPNSTRLDPDMNRTGIEYISLGFTTPVHTNGAIIRETCGNGFVARIDAIDTNNIAHNVWQGTDTSTGGAAYDFLATWTTTSYLVNGLKIYVDTAKDVNSWEEMDSVAIQIVG